MDHLPEEDHRNAFTPITLRKLAQHLLTYSPDWEIEVRLVGDKVIRLDLDVEDIHAENGKIYLVVGSVHTIHVEPLDLDEML